MENGDTGNRSEAVVVDMGESVSNSSRSTFNFDSIQRGTERLSLLDREKLSNILKEELKNRIKTTGPTDGIDQTTFGKLLSDEKVLKIVFKLFDAQSEGRIYPSHLIELFKDALGEKSYEFVNLFETLIVVFANEASELDFELFQRIFALNVVQNVLYSMIEITNSPGDVTVGTVAEFVTEFTKTRKMKGEEEQLKNVAKIFSSYLKEGNDELTLEDFKELIPSKNPFFAERAFRLFDRDGSNRISITEFRETLQQFSNQSVDGKVRFLFQIYDQNGDGVVKLGELKSVLAACSEENGMQFSDAQMNQLTLALYEDAKQCGLDGALCDDGIGFEEFKAQMTRQPGLLENLATSLEQFLVPKTTYKNKKDQHSSSSIFSKKYLRNNIPMVSFMISYIIINVILFTTRSVDVYMNTKNVFYMLAKASGQVLNFNCTLVVVLMLRHCITWLRMRGLASILPLDHHVYLHKFCGAMIVFFSLLHTAMHLINFPLSIADQRVSTVTNRTHSAVEWLFTVNHGEFGLVGGWASLTGWILWLTLGFMAVFSLPFVRKSGCFEMFYWSHLLYIPFWINLILHGPNFWYWFVGPGVLFIVFEKIIQSINRYSSQGRSYVSSAVLLPSRVTHLVIKKPPNFHYHPGDYVYIQIPSLTRYEWHPFTISSAPELPDFLWLHVRCAGGWTNKLYEFFELKMAQVNWHQHQRSLSRKTSNMSILTNDFSSINQSLAGNMDWSGEAGVFQRNHLFYSSCPPIQPSRRHDSLASTDSHRRMIYRNSLLPSRIINIPIPMITDDSSFRGRSNNISTLNTTYDPETIGTKQFSSTNNEILGVYDLPKRDSSASTNTIISSRNSLIGTETFQLDEAIEVTIDGPYGTPSCHIFRSEHAVLIAAGIGVTPFASILQSIMNRYYAARQTCPSCQLTWTSQMPDSILNLNKVDFIWINRDQQSFEWFVNLLSQLETQQAEMGGALERFLDLHMYITSALNKNNMKAVGLQMALDLLYSKEQRDLVTGLRTRSNAGRPNWDQVFKKIRDEKKGKVTVFYCGPPQLARELKGKCDTFGFSFRKETF